MPSKSNLLISARERLLNLILKVDPAGFFNAGHSTPDNGIPGSAVANKLKETLNQVKVLVVTTDGSQVDYQQLANSPLYLSYREQSAELARFDYRSLKGNDQLLAFWINLYNALVIDAVIQENVKNSVTESWLGILGFFQKAAYLVNGQRFSLTDIEHGVLRGNRGFPYFPGQHFSGIDPRLDSVIPEVDPRIHFALNCASQSCPPIGVYSPEKIQDQLDLAARNFINNDLIINPEANLIHVSKIFQWYLGDFGGIQALPAYLADYLIDPDSKLWIMNNQANLRIKFHPYDWSLNRIRL